MSRYRDPQLPRLCLATATHNFQVGENYSYLFNLRPNICKSWCLNAHFILNNCDLQLQLFDRQLFDKQLLDKQLFDKQLFDKQLFDKQLFDKQLFDKQLFDKQLLDKQL